MELALGVLAISLQPAVDGHDARQVADVTMEGGKTKEKTRENSVTC